MDKKRKCYILFQRLWSYCCFQLPTMHLGLPSLQCWRFHSAVCWCRPCTGPWSRRSAGNRWRWCWSSWWCTGYTGTRWCWCGALLDTTPGNPSHAPQRTLLNLETNQVYSDFVVQFEITVCFPSPPPCILTPLMVVLHTSTATDSNLGSVVRLSL